jgi:hypothetical protein
MNPKDYEKQCRNAILKKGLIDPKIVEKMTLNEMIEHLVKASFSIKIEDRNWIPERLKVTP